MVIYKSQDLADDRVLVMDADSGKQWVLPRAFWEEIEWLIASEQEARIRAHLDANRDALGRDSGRGSGPEAARVARAGGVALVPLKGVVRGAPAP